ncbi:MAG: DUF2938 domain-containing protein [Pseudomonadota bacterium]
MGDMLRSAFIIGMGATMILDATSLLRRMFLSQPLPNYPLVGRWIGHMGRGVFSHTSIKAAAPIPGEVILGWGAHYAIGVMFALGFIASMGEKWTEQPTLIPALIFGAVTVVFPFVLMQPGMGLGIAASLTPDPWAARLKSLISHLLFGVGLFLAAALWARIKGAGAIS